MNVDPSAQLRPPRPSRELSANISNLGNTLLLTRLDIVKLVLDVLGLISLIINALVTSSYALATTVVASCY